MGSIKHKTITSFIVRTFRYFILSIKSLRSWNLGVMNNGHHECTKVYSSSRNRIRLVSLLRSFSVRSKSLFCTPSHQKGPNPVIRYICIYNKLKIVVESDPKAPFSIATTPRYWGGRDSFPWISPLYPWSLPYNAV